MLIAAIILAGRWWGPSSRTLIHIPNHGSAAAASPTDGRRLHCPAERHPFHGAYRSMSLWGDQFVPTVDRFSQDAPWGLSGVIPTVVFLVRRSCPSVERDDD